MRLVLEFDEGGVSVKLEMSHREFLEVAGELLGLVTGQYGGAGEKARAELSEECGHCGGTGDEGA